MCVEWYFTTYYIYLTDFSNWLLVNFFIYLSSSKKLLPTFYFFPRAKYPLMGIELPILKFEFY